MAISSSKEGTDSPWHETAKERGKMFSLITPNDLLVYNKTNFWISIYMFFEHFWKTNQYNEVGGCSYQWTKWRKKKKKKKNEFRDSNSHLKGFINDPKVSMCVLKDTICLIAAEQRFLKIKHGILSYDWLNYNA